MAKDPAVLAHQEWLGYVQPVGLVVSIPAMLDANVRINQNIAPDHRRFLEALTPDSAGEPIPEVSDFPKFAETVLGWTPNDLYGTPGATALPDTLEISLPDYNETLRPTYALREFEPAENGRQWILLVKVLPLGSDFDAVEELDSRHWQASPQAKFERLLRQTQIPIGLLFNGKQIRLVYAPEKELSGYATFKIADMVKVAGRPIFAAFHMLLSFERLYSVAERERLPAILENSRKYQNVVSTQLASQVLQALYEILRGFQAADDQAQGQLLHDVLAKDPTTSTADCSQPFCGWSSCFMRRIAVFSPPIQFSRTTTRLQGSMSGYASTMGDTQTPWISVTALGHSCSRSFDSFIAVAATQL
jgi:hypothetical protein